MLQIVLGDITKESVDAIVNAANTGLLGGGKWMPERGFSVYQHGCLPIPSGNCF